MSNPTNQLIEQVAQAYLAMRPDPMRSPLEQCSATIEPIVRPFIDGFCQENAELRAELNEHMKQLAVAQFAAVKSQADVDELLLQRSELCNQRNQLNEQLIAIRKNDEGKK